jgi:hypothetical protein
MDLERNQYETEEQVSFESPPEGGEAQSQETDELIERLQELARRQEKLEEQVARNEQMTDQERWEQRSLQRETEELL